MTEFQEMLTQARDAVTVKKVFGEPYQHNGITIIPAAKITGGAGGGGGTGGNQERGFGGGYGVMSSPVGTYVLVGAVITIFTLGTIRSIVKTLAKHR